LLLAPVLAALVVVSGVALAATKVGTRDNDRLVGTNNNSDVLKGKAANDRLFGKGGDDDDLLNGGGGRDRPSRLLGRSRT